MAAAPDTPSRTTRALARFVDAIVRRRTLSLVVLGLVFVVALLGALRLHVNLSSTAFYGDGSTAAARLAQFQATWGADDSSLVILVETEPGRDSRGSGILSKDGLAAMAELGEALAAHPEVRSLTSIADIEVPAPPLAEAPVRLTELLTRFDLSELSPVEREVLLRDLPFVPTLLSADGQSATIMVELGFSTDDVVRTHAVVAELEAVIAELEPRLHAAGVQHELAGIPAIRAGFFELLIHDQAMFVPLTLLVIGLALLAVFRRVHGVVIPAVAAAAPTAMLVGVMGWAGEPIGLLNQAYFTLLPVIAVADAIHMVARFHEERRIRGPGPEAQHAAIVAACSRVGLACLLTSVTTAAGFASLVTAEMPILRGFGLFAALGVGLAFVVELALVPLLLSFVRANASPPPARKYGIEAVVDWVVGRATRRPWAVILVSAALMGLALIPAREVEIDNRLSNLIDAEHPASLASAHIDAKHGGVLSLEFELRPETDGPDRVDLRDPELLAAVLEFETWLGAQPEVRTVEGLATALDEAGVLVDGPDAFPTSRAQIDARLAALAPYAPLDRMIRVGDDDGPPRLRIRAGMPDTGGQGFVAFADEAEAELRGRLEATELGPRVEAHATGTALLAYRGVNGITADLRRSFALVFVVVVGLLGLLFRNPWPAAIALLPNLAPLVLGYALLGVLGLVLDPLAAVILTLALGIAVDDSIHVLVRTREELARFAADERSAKDRAIAAVRVSLRHAGLAVAVTSIVIIGGLVLDLGSSFPPLRLLGLLGSVVIGLALLANLTLLPALIVVTSGRGLSRP